jgi:transposase-like protein
MTRKRYTKEFKQDAVRLVIEHGYTQAEAGRNFGINAKMLGRWIQEFRADASEAFRREWQADGGAGRAPATAESTARSSPSFW